MHPFALKLKRQHNLQIPSLFTLKLTNVAQKTPEDTCKWYFWWVHFIKLHNNNSHVAADDEKINNDQEKWARLKKNPTHYVQWVSLEVHGHRHLVNLVWGPRVCTMLYPDLPQPYHPWEKKNWKEWRRWKAISAVRQGRDHGIMAERGIGQGIFIKAPSQNRNPNLEKSQTGCRL